MGDKLTDFGPIGQYIPLFILGVIAIVLGLLLANLSKLMGPFRPNKIKDSVYESGMDPVGTAHDRFSVKFYMVAMLFILFDIEVVFMYPWAVNFTQLANLDKLQGGSGIFPLMEMFVFVVILFVGYIYVWKKDGLEWD
jgi:NADH-quinone oxidoreductase subunit A